MIKLTEDKVLTSRKNGVFDGHIDYSYYGFNPDDITVVIPTLNEEPAIGMVLQDIQRERYENVIVVDGYSSDGTTKVVSKFGVKCVNQEGKGKTGAIKTAIKNVRTPYLALIDGDCTYSAKDIEKLAPHIANNYQVIGARISGRENIPALNRFGNWLINTLFNLLFATKLSDVCSGMYLLQTQFAKTLPLLTKGFDVEVEIATYAAHHGKVVEVPISYHQRVGTQKLHPFRDGAKIIYRILKQGLRMFPLRLISLAEALLLLPSMMLINSRFDLHLFTYQQSSFTFGFILLVLAVQGITLYTVDTRFVRRNGRTANNS